LQVPRGSRLGDATNELEEAPARRAVGRNFRRVDEARAVAEELGATVPQVALAWLLRRPGVTAPIIGPRTPEQLDDLLGAPGLVLSDPQLARLSATTAPPERSPDRFLREQSGIDVEQQALRGVREAVL
jgi:aryl-alcohol dehydrogenase-like predicted oxidoreductase